MAYTCAILVGVSSDVDVQDRWHIRGQMFVVMFVVMLFCLLHWWCLGLTLLLIFSHVLTRGFYL